MGDDQHGAGGERSAIAVAQDRVIHLSAALPIRPATAFEHFTNNELLQAWLARVADVELRIGGRYELFWDPAHREDNSTIGCRITAIAEPELLAFQWRSPAQFKSFANTADPLTHVAQVAIPRTPRACAVLTTTVVEDEPASASDVVPDIQRGAAEHLDLVDGRGPRWDA